MSRDPCRPAEVSYGQPPLPVDPFGGSGTTLITAARCGRRARLVELDPRYCDVIRRRWARFEQEQRHRNAAA
jgi:DNA modification methylase